MDKKSRRITVYLVLFFCVSVGFRLWFITLAPQPFIFDQTQYDELARGILEKGLYAYKNRLWGMPMLLALTYRVYGIGNHQAWFFVQAVMEGITAIVIFSAARLVFKSEKPGLAAAVLYAVNPFTAAYTGMLLTEIPSALFLAMSFFLAVRMAHKWSWLTAAIFGLAAGMLPNIRPALAIISAAYMAMVLYRIRIQPDAVKKTAAVLFMFFLPFIYTVAGNRVYFGEWAFLTADNLFPRELYLSTFVGRSPLHAESSAAFPKEVEQAWGEYELTMDREGMKRLSKKYLNLSWERITNDPGAFLIMRINKLRYVWEKHVLFYFRDRIDPAVNAAMYWFNGILVVTAFVTMILTWRSNVKLKYPAGSFAGFLGVMTVLLISIGHMTSLTEERYSLPAYPVIFLFAGYGAYTAFRWAVSRYNEIVFRK